MKTFIKAIIAEILKILNAIDQALVPPIGLDRLHAPLHGNTSLTSSDVYNRLREFRYGMI